MLKKIIPPILLLLISLIVACDKKNDPPTLSDPYAPDSLIRGSTDTAFVRVTAIDPDGADDIDSVYFVVTRPDTSSSGFHFAMNDEGLLGDSVAGDNRYTTGILPPSTAAQIGNYIFTIYSYDKHDNKSNHLALVVNVHDRPNSPPYLSDLSAPDSLVRGETISSCFSVTVIDPDGINEIDSVYYIVIRPDGLSNGSHFEMLDDEGFCDVAMGDSIYSTSVEPPPESALLGDYQFVFFGVDIHDNVSDSLNTTITVYQRE
jgi:hypothetical protein